MFNKVGCEIPWADAEVCHRLTNGNDKIIVKSSGRKDCNQVMPVKRDFRKVKLEDVGLRESNPIFINQSLHPYYRMLWSKSKRLHDLGKINNQFIRCGKVKIKNKIVGKQ